MTWRFFGYSIRSSLVKVFLLAVITLGLAFGIILVSQRQMFFKSAEEIAPKMVLLPGKASLRFKIRFQGVTSTAMDKKVAVTIKQAEVAVSGPTIIKVLSDANGLYLGEVVNIAPGTYDIYVKGEAHLRHKFPAVFLNEGINDFDLTGVVLKAGDFDENNQIDIRDVALINAQNTDLNVPITETNRIFDIDGNSAININDVAIVLSNYDSFDVKGD